MNTTTNTLTATEVLTEARKMRYADNLGEAAMEVERWAEVSRRLDVAIRKGFAYITAEGEICLTHLGEDLVEGR